MNHPHITQPSTTARVTAFVAAAGMTTLLVVSQFGLASHYTGDADQRLAQQRLTAPVTTTQALPVRQPV